MNSADAKHPTRTSSAVTDKVDSIIDKQLRKAAQELSYATIEPMSPEWPFSTNGIYFFCGKMGSGKTYTIMKHVLVSERLYEDPYYDTIIFTSTSGTLDKTVSAMKKDVRTPITYVKDTDLMEHLKTHIERKMTYYAVMRFVNSGGEEIDDVMKGILEKLKPYRIIDRKRVYDWSRIAQYLKQMMSSFGFTRYPSNTLLIMDDFAGHPLLAKVESPFHEYQSIGHGGLQQSCGFTDPPRRYSGYIMPLIGVGLGAGYGTYKIFGRFKDEPVSETNTSIKTPAPTPTPTIYRIMRSRRYRGPPRK